MMNEETNPTYLSKVAKGFLSLRGSPSELWKAYWLKFLDSTSYFSFSIIFTLFLSNDFGYSDVVAGTLYGAWGAAITIFGIAAGVLIDNLGVARSLQVGFTISLVAKCLIFIAKSRLVLLLGFCLLSLGSTLGIPVLTVGIRRYTTEKNRGFAFGLFYVIMNLGALLSGVLVDFCTIWYKGLVNDAEDEGAASNAVGNDDGDNAIIWTLDGYRLTILVGIFLNIIACITTFTIKEIKVANEVHSRNEKDGSESSHGIDQESPSQSVQTFQPNKASAIQILRETMQSKSFWRFLVVILITINVRMIFRHLDATLPKYMMREFGDQVPKGTIYSINPFLIMILVPIVTATTTDVDPLIMIHHGSYISALSVFSLVISTSVPSCIIFVIFLSIGEAVWSPRLYDYTMSICEEGREGTYMALSSAPLFLAKLPVGWMSGYLLEKYCPKDGVRDSKIMWLIIGLTTLVSPVLMTSCWGYISKKDDDDEISHDELEEANEMVPIVNENDSLIMEGTMSRRRMSPSPAM